MKWRWIWLKGLLSRRAHYTGTGKPKVSYGSRTTALRAAQAMKKSTGREFDAYRCWFYCRKWHVGGAVPR